MKVMIKNWPLCVVCVIQQVPQFEGVYQVHVEKLYSFTKDFTLLFAEKIKYTLILQTFNFN